MSIQPAFVVQTLGDQDMGQSQCQRPVAAGKGWNSMYAVFQMPNQAGAYWGIEETRFIDAPILRNPDLKRKLDRRTYQFYFNGGHIHLIAILHGGVAYWVANTLRDDLSNPAMIAIARSLRPVR